MLSKHTVSLQKNDILLHFFSLLIQEHIFISLSLDLLRLYRSSAIQILEMSYYRNNNVVELFELQLKLLTLPL